MDRTRFLVDKLSGKFNIDQRYLNKRGGQSALEEEENRLYQQSLKYQVQDEKSGENLLANYKRPASKLDKYIDLILKNVTNVNEFIYLKRNGDDDPYDLIVVDFKRIQEEEEKKNLREYYTISRKGICQYLNGKPVEFIQLPTWMKERQTYDKIKSL